MKNVKMDICFPNYLTDEVKRCIKSTLESLGVIDMKMSEIDSELLDIVIPEEKLETVKNFPKSLGNCRPWWTLYARIDRISQNVEKGRKLLFSFFFQM